ncbi:Hypothetical predicted protein [Mytilus galloprovincialis]|uniref:Vacuolar protein sorting-associated protein 13 VPS13 adaptor binding domain-containing protein n=1 Tax=Mytilus galloprovincialis TaxID=29158 RepID=A0A8B6GR57_MYTGA|nr:Hypothetical predicted protein [Mytilus galloprovincialis]
MYDELDAGPQLDNTEEGEKEEPRPQSYYIIMASQDQLLLNVTPQAIDVLTDVTNVSQSYYIIMASQDQLLLNVTPQAIDVLTDVTNVSQSYYIIMASQDQLLLNVTPQAIDVLTDVTNVSQSYYIIMASQDQHLLLNVTPQAIDVLTDVTNVSQSYYIIMASQDQLLLNVTPQAIDVLTDVTNVSQSYYIIMASQDQLLLNVTPQAIDVLTDVSNVSQSYYIIMASQDQLLLNVTPQAIDVLTDVTNAMMTPEAVEGESKSRPAFEINNQLGLDTSMVLHPDIKVHENHVKKCHVLRQGKDDNQVKIVLRDENDERIDLPDIKEECGDDVDGLVSRSDDFVAETLAAFGNMMTSSGAFVFDDDPDYLSGDKMDINRLKIQVDGFDLSSTIFHKRACLQLFPLTPDKHSTKYWYLLHIDVVHGSKVIKIMSPLKMENSLTFAVDIYCKTEDLKQYGISVTYIELGQYSKLKTLQPGQEYVIPLFLAYNSDLFVAPTDLRGIQIHNNGIWWKDIQRTKERAKTYTCTGGTDGDKVFKVYLADGKKLTPRQEVPKGVPYFTLVLKPPVLIHNYLPYDLQYSLEGSGNFSKLKHGESTPLDTVESSKSYKLHLQLQDYLGCDWAGIFDLLDSQNLEEFKAVTMTSYDGGDENANKHLALIVNASVKMSLDLYIYSPYWIINKTDLPILIRGSNSDAVYDCTLPSADSSLAPSILFRFKKHKRKKAKLKVYESKWSQSFSMDTVGNSGVVICYDKERKIKYRLLLQCQWSHLKLSRIVTITPFFLVINKSSYNLWYMEKNEEKDLWLDLKKNQCSPFWPCTDNGKLCVRYDNSNISSSYIPINTVCNTVLRMENGRAMCVNVSGGIESPRSITFTDYDIGDSPVRIENLCEDVFIVIHQW